MSLLNNLSQAVKDKIHERVLGKTVMLKARGQGLEKQKTLFIDLDETLIHSTKEEIPGLTEKISINDSEVRNRNN